MRKGIDLSNFWLPGPINDDEAFERMHQAKEEGYSHVIALANPPFPSVCNQQLDAAVRAGMTIDAYWYVYFSRDLETQIEICRYATEGLPVGKLWIDLEDEPNSDPYSVLGQISLLAKLARGKGFDPAIYTRRDWWFRNTGDSRKFSSYKLWIAEWDDVNVCTPTNFRGLGGWWRPAWKQWLANQEVAGMKVDLNIAA